MIAIGKKTHTFEIPFADIMPAQPTITIFACPGWWNFRKSKSKMSNRRCEIYENAEK